MGDHKENRDYNRGYHDGRSGKREDGSSIIETFIDTIVPGNNPPSRDYREGYQDGAGDRKRSK